MKCAMELIGIKAIADAEYEAEQRKKDLEAMRVFKEAMQNSVTLCETVVNDTMVNNAEMRHTLSMDLTISTTTDRIGNKIFYLITKDAHTRYADGSPSYSRDTNMIFALDTFIEYLEQHCYTVYPYNASYRCYGLGECPCIRLNISVTTPDCAE